jgi:hypothetical protein
MKHYTNSTVSCLKRPGLSVTDALEVLHSLSRIHLFLPFSLSVNILDQATDHQSRFHFTDVSKQLSSSDHLAQTELWQTALRNIQIDIVHIREILLCKIKKFLPSVNPKILPLKNWFVVRKSVDNMLFLFQEAQFGPGTPCWCSYGWSRYHECHRIVPRGELVNTYMGVTCTVKLWML